MAGWEGRRRGATINFAKIQDSGVKITTSKSHILGKSWKGATINFAEIQESEGENSY